MRLPSSSLVSLFSMSVVYLWTACFALREVFLYSKLVGTRRHELLTRAATPSVWLTFVALHCFVRVCLAFVAEFVRDTSASADLYDVVIGDVRLLHSPYTHSPSSSATLSIYAGSVWPSCVPSLTPCPPHSLRLQVPGLAIVGLYSWLLVSMIGAAVLPRGQRRGRAASDRRSACASALPCTVRNCLKFCFVGGFLAYFVMLVVLVSPSASSAYGARDAIFLFLFLTIVMASHYFLCLTRTDAASGALPSALGLSLATCRMMCLVIGVMFVLRSAVLVFIVFGFGVGFSGTKPVVLGPSEPAALVLSYYLPSIIGEAWAVYLMRSSSGLGAKGDESLERQCLPANLEIKASEISLQGGVIGRGGFGEVYKALFRNHQIVAVKKFSPMALRLPERRGDASSEESLLSDDPSTSFSDGVGRRRRFVREAQILCSLRHPRIVQLVGYSFLRGNHTTWDRQQEVAETWTDGGFALVMEYVANGSLFHAIHRRRVELAGKFCLIAAGIADGLTFLHNSGIVRLVAVGWRGMHVEGTSGRAGRILDGCVW